MINIAFICTHNSCRSIMAEALANALLSKTVIAYSAGSAPSGNINPYALEVLEKNAIDTNGLYSKSIVDLQSIQFDVVITLCGNAKNESCPIWVGKCLKAHWGFDDPSQITDSEKRKKAFDDLFMKLKDILIKFAKRIELEPHELQKHITFIEKALS
ncbi:MAG: arsenate reductase ArsC [Proteobacteria bacterium]|jgi:arsenate reductase (thioredoxin)|nr:arsenate reductase ArsC [Pseudomonadota bacterium]MDA0942146.1 arsenate reductase ArsC [Pseudomonadota bacterium]